MDNPLKMFIDSNYLPISIKRSRIYKKIITENLDVNNKVFKV